MLKDDFLAIIDDIECIFISQKYWRSQKLQTYGYNCDIVQCNTRV